VRDVSKEAETAERVRNDGKTFMLVPIFTSLAARAPPLSPLSQKRTEGQGHHAPTRPQLRGQGGGGGRPAAEVGAVGHA